MTFANFEKKFIERALVSGYSQDNIDRCLNYARPLLDKGYPVIFNTANFSALVGYKKSYIKRAIFFNNYFYRDFEIKKVNGGTRTISEPLPSLKEIQDWILRNILDRCKVSRLAKAYIKGRSVVENVKFHKGQDIVLKLDVKNFFPSIGTNQVLEIFQSFGYSEIVSSLLAKLCCRNGGLPQGSPTSPSLSNIYLIQFDHKIFLFCKERNIRYTRYADDLTFSFEKTVDQNELINFVTASLEERNLKVNENKTKRFTASDRQVITGVVVNEKIQLPREYRNKIRKEVYFIKKFGLEDHISFVKNKKANYLPHLIGKVNYALHINPMDSEMLAYKNFLHYLKGV